MENLGSFQTVLFYIAIFTSVIFVIQTILMLIGFDSDGDTDIDVSDDPDFDAAQEDQGQSFGWFTFKNIINFFLIFSWAGLACIDAGWSHGISLTVATLAGIAFIKVFHLIMKSMMKLSEDGTTSITQAIGLPGSVYLYIDKDKPGKVTIVLGGVTQQYDAISNDNSRIETGAQIQVIAIKGNQLVVEEI